MEKTMRPHPGIRIDRIPAAGGGGLIFAVGIPLLVLIAMPAVRPIVAVAAVAGLLLAPVLHWRNTH
jgi:hypothetical protein